MNLFDAVLFDFDGTIADTSTGIFNSIRYALAQESIPVGDASALSYFIGPPLYDGFQHVYGVSHEQACRLVEEYRVFYANKGVYQCTVYPGVRELLTELHGTGAKLAVTSSKPLHFLKVVLPYLELDQLFDAVVGPDLNNENADKTSLCLSACSRLGVQADRRTAMVGDRCYDMSGAVKAGLTAVGAAYGFGSAEELRDAGAHCLAEDAAALRSILIKNDE